MLAEAYKFACTIGGVMVAFDFLLVPSESGRILNVWTLNWNTADKRAGKCIPRLPIPAIQERA